MINEIIIIVLLIIGSGFFSGLTIALMSFEIEDLETIKNIGGEGDAPYTKEDAKKASKILKIIQDKKLLVVTLLLGNTAVNAALSIFLANIVGEGLVAGIVSTGLIVIFGEIIPVVVITKYALQVGAYVSEFVKLLITIFYPISFFIIKGLNFLENILGENQIYNLSRREMVYNIKKLKEDDSSDIDEFDSSMIEGALSLSDKKLKDVMTLRNNVFRLQENRKIDKELLEEIIASGHTRIPVFKDVEHEEYIGVFNVKKLIGEYPIGKKVGQFVNKDAKLILNTEMSCDDAIIKLIDTRLHIALVSNENFWEGIVTLEDIVEEIIKKEIIDEFDKE
jgi:metal transporter CNNM